MVDGAPRPATVVALSHWPKSPMPDRLRRDLSAEIALAAMETGYVDEVREKTSLATIDHFDEDGVIAIAFLVLPGIADSSAELLVEAARVGDFGVVRDRRSALVSFAVGAVGRGEAAPDASRRPTGAGACAKAAGTALALLGGLVTEPARFEALWSAEAASYDASAALIRARRCVSVEEIPEHDLAIVRITRRGSEVDELEAARWSGRPLHPAAVNSVTDCMRVAVLEDHRYEVRYRYETWVRMTSVRLRPRVDLTGLASELSELERRAASNPTGSDQEPVTWCFDGANATRPTMRTARSRASGIRQDDFVQLLVSHLGRLDGGPPAWDPYR